MPCPAPGPLFVHQSGEVRAVHPPAVVLQLDVEHPVFKSHAYLQTALPLSAPESVADTVLHEGLQEKLMYLHILYPLRDIHRHLDLFAQLFLLQQHILPKPVQLSPDGRLLPGIDV